MPMRSMGATSLNPGQIEVTLNDRLTFYDSAGIAEPMDERDAAGNPISVQTSFYL